jgi:alginate O-acetyltransferase complex protein AlgJ
VDLVADRLATTVHGLVHLKPADSVRYTSEAATISNTGDLTEMLELPAVFPRQEVRIGVVRNNDGTPWRRRRSADVMLLGDSFTNIYSQEGLGWGAGAGLAERLSYHLQQPIDALVRNDDGAVATRLLLSREVAQAPDRLAGVQLVIWEFAARELSAGDWRLVAMESAPPPAAEFIVPPRGSTIIVEGTVAALAETPDPRKAPYADYIIGLHLVDVISDETLEGDQALVFTWAMRGRRLTAGAGYRVGQRLRLELRPWADVTQEFESVARGELYENNLLLQTPCWGEEASE